MPRPPATPSPDPLSAAALGPRERLDATLVGIGEDGWEGLGAPARTALQDADLILGSARQIELMPAALSARARQWPSPMAPLLDRLATALAPSDATSETGAAPKRLALLASGSPMLHGLGGSLARRGARIAVIPHVSAFSLACARLGWPEEETVLVSACGKPLEGVLRHTHDGARLIVLSADSTTPSQLGALLTQAGFGGSVCHALERLGGPHEAARTMIAQDLAEAPRTIAPLNLVAVEAVADEGVRRLPPFGLPDDAFDHDGQITKRDIRLTALARLNPAPSELLWDIGAGAGSIGIEWCRMAQGARSLGVEKSRHRAERARANALKLGAPLARFVTLRLPDEMETLLRENPERPDAIFIGGGVSALGLLDKLMELLVPGGRVVAHAVTLESEAVLLAAAKAHGGELSRLHIDAPHKVGDFTTLKPGMPVLQWFWTKPASNAGANAD